MLFSMSHGFFAAILMIYLPAQLTDEREKEMVGDIILLALALGVVLGSLLSFGSVALIN